jgi:hypothetical protein
MHACLVSASTPELRALRRRIHACLVSAFTPELRARLGTYGLLGMVSRASLCHVNMCDHSQDVRALASWFVVT